ncbi:MAG TPA: phage major capsid protein [Pilimelia sp.]|nr:phage major capsid protein [Pilimelia sp.]
MTLAELIARAQAELRTAIAARRTAQDALVALRDDPNLTEQAVLDATAARDTADAEVTRRQAALDDLLAEQAREEELTALSQRITPTGARTGGARVTNEPEVYRRGGNVSYFRDLYRAQHGNDRTAVERLARNDQQVRALTTTDGAGGDFVPPLWMVNQFVELARAGRVVADQIAQQPLPGGTDTISLPKLATGTAVAEQATQNTAVQNTDATTSSVSAAVATIAGQQVISQQLLDQSPVNMDDVLLADLAADYAIKLDTFVINNNAANKVGLLNVSGANAITYTDASPTPGELYAKVADAIQQIHTNRYMPADKILMHPRRWAWFLAALDTAGRPLVTPDAMNSIAQQGGVVSQGRVGTLQGLPVYVDPNIPTNLGAGTNEDRIIVLRSTDSILYEGTPRSETFRETKADQLSVLLRFYNYAALHASRLPKSISIISGTGLATPTF